MIELQHLYKRYRTEHGAGRWILEDVNITIPYGRSVGVVGSNGAGKSTLLRLIGGIDVPNRGRVIRHSRVSWPLGLSGGLHGSLTGRQNAKFVCRIHGHAHDLAKNINFIAEFSELGDAFDEPIKTYSSGMQARLKFAMSMAFDFEVFLVDELTSVGDSAFRAKAKTAFDERASRSSLVMVSHGENLLREFCTSGIFLHQGHASWFEKLDDALSTYKESLKK
jgi:capsular polysaccharide transport system ATP-binding protein